jgi:hypothetical protein
LEGDEQVNVDRPTTKRVCFSGSRQYRNLKVIAQHIMKLDRGTIVVHGGARGVDTEVERMATQLGFMTEIWKPDWDKYGRAAGPKRNQDMIATCDKLIAFWDGNSPGTRSAITFAEQFELPVTLVMDKGK